jgi:NADH-quinone oxidoreductase subunit H
VPVLWWFLKVCLFLYMYIWLRGTLPRFRYDQFMHFGWRVLIPVSLVWLVLVTGARAVQQEYDLPTRNLLLIGALVLVLAIAVQYAAERRRAVREQAELRRAEALAAEFDPYAGGYPVPPMPDQDFLFTPRARRTVPGTALTTDEAPATSQEGSDG